MTASSTSSNGPTNIQFQVVNLPRRTDRKTRFLKQNAQTPGLDFVFSHAIDKNVLNPEEVRSKGLLGPSATIAEGHLACALSHRQLWLEGKKANEAYFICEDDAVFRVDFHSQWEALSEQLSPDWDIVLFGYNFDSCLSLELISGVQDTLGWFSNKPIDLKEIDRFRHGEDPVLTRKLLSAFGLLAYAITPQGADKLLRNCFPLRNQDVPIPSLRRVVPAFSVDCLMNQYYRHWNSYAVFPPLAISPNDKSQSDTT